MSPPLLFKSFFKETHPSGSAKFTFPTLLWLVDEKQAELMITHGHQTVCGTHNTVFFIRCVKYKLSLFWHINSCSVYRQSTLHVAWKYSPEMPSSAARTSPISRSGVTFNPRDSKVIFAYIGRWNRVIVLKVTSKSQVLSLKSHTRPQPAMRSPRSGQQ